MTKKKNRKREEKFESNYIGKNTLMLIITSNQLKSKDLGLQETRKKWRRKKKMLKWKKERWHNCLTTVGNSKVCHIILLYQLKNKKGTNLKKKHSLHARKVIINICPSYMILHYQNKINILFVETNDLGFTWAIIYSKES